MILAIDPGPELSAFVLYDENRRSLRFRTWKDEGFSKRPNAYVLDMVRSRARHGDKEDQIVIEQIASYGMPVGREIFETCIWIGRFVEAWESETLRAPALLTRGAVKLHLCGSMRAKDANVRQALLDAFGGKDKAVGKKAQPGPLWGVSGDVWSALAVAVTYADRTEGHNDATMAQ